MFAAPLVAPALPGDAAGGGTPQLRTPVSSATACLDADNTIHLWANFHTLDGVEAGGVIRLAADGSTGAILAPGLVPSPTPDGIPVMSVYDFKIQQRVFLVDEAGQPLPEAPVFDPALNRPATMTATPDGGYRLIFGVDPSQFMYWPSPTSFESRIEWRSNDHTLVRTRSFSTPASFGPLVFAEESGGRVLATGLNGELCRFNADGTPDPTFTSPGYVSSILPLPGGRWLINGLKRILADGSPDPGWQPSALETPPNITRLAITPDGGVLIAGDFRKLNNTTVPGLVKLTAEGVPFPGFTPDPRLGRVTAIAVMPDQSITVAVATLITLADGRSSRLLRLLPNGTIDESVFPPPPAFPGFTVPNSTIAQLACQADGKLLVFTEFYGGEVSTSTLSRRLPDLSVDPSFAIHNNYTVASPLLLPLADGRIFVGSKLLDANGHLLENIAVLDQGSYSPRCQMADGAVVFTTLYQSGGTTSTRLVRWTNGTWDSAFESAVNSPVGSLSAIAGADGKIYVTGWLAGAVAPGTQLVRLHRNGRLDAAFRAPPLTQQIRRGSGPWFTHTPTGLASFDPVAAATTAWAPIVRWQAATNRLWLAGSFNMAGTTACDGLIALDGTNATGYLAWSQAALRDLPADAGADRDPDGDGCANFLEYATGGDPLRPDAAAGAPQPVPAAPLRFSLWKNPEAAELYPIIRTSGDLTHWQTATGADVLLYSTAGQVIFELLPGTPRRFARVEFIAP